MKVSGGEQKDVPKKKRKKERGNKLGQKLPIRWRIYKDKFRDNIQNLNRA
jgi:hypothetical protein